MTLKELAKQMAQFYKDNPGSWTQGAAARDKHGDSVSAFSDKAAQWCLVGLANKLAPGSFDTRYSLYDKMGETYASSWNDGPGRTIEQVIEKLESI